MTAAHEQEVVVRFIERFPDHPAREDDPHYSAFEATKRRLKKDPTLWRCAVDSPYHWGGLEVHHSKVEFSHIPDIDVAKFDALYGLHLAEAEFADFIEQEGNCEVLCTLHHRGQEGVHSLPEPEWLALRVSRSDRQIITAEANSLIPVVQETT